MKTNAVVLLALALPLLPAAAQDEDARVPVEIQRAQDRAKHQLGSTKLAGDQDEVSADVQELIEEQTAENVISLLEEVEEIMGEIIGNLDQSETGGPTIAAETEVIEKIFEAAKKRSQGKGQGTPGAMLDMMERMMGKSPGSEPGQEPGDQAGEGMTGDSDAANNNTEGTVRGPSETRRVPKGSGTAGTDLPQEFQKALDAYNKPTTRSTTP